MSCLNLNHQISNRLRQFYLNFNHFVRKHKLKLDPFQAKGLFIFKAVFVYNALNQFHRTPIISWIPNFKHILVYSLSKTQDLNTQLKK